MSLREKETVAGRPLGVGRIKAENSKEKDREEFHEGQLPAEVAGVRAGVHRQIEEVLPELAAEPAKGLHIRRHRDRAGLEAYAGRMTHGSRLLSSDRIWPASGASIP